MDHGLHIGPIHVAFSGASAPDVRYSSWTYRDFRSPPQGEGGSVAVQVQCRMRVEAGGLPLPTGVPLYEAGRNWAIWEEPEDWLICSEYVYRDGPRVSCRLSRAHNRATLHVDGDPTDAPLRYPLDQILTWGLLGQCGGVLLHAAAVVRDGVGLVLVGRSGAGKSTLAELCHAHGWEILNDDRVIVYPDAAGVWQVAGTPWHGSGRFAQNRTAPLRGVCMLRQSTVDAIEPVAASEARLGLLDVASIPWFEPDWSQHTLDALAQLPQDVPVHRFCFSRTANAVAVLKKCVWQIEGEIR